MNPNVRRPVQWSRLATWTGGAALFVLALLPRLEAAPYGLPYLYPWDEPYYSSFAFRMVATGDLNPHFFNYPTFPTYLYALGDVVVLRAGGRAAEVEPGSPAWQASAEDEWNVPETRLALVHRRVTAVAGALTCALTFLLGARLGLPWAGLAAGLLTAWSPYLVEETAHAAVDPWMTLFTLCAVLPLTGAAPSRRALTLSAVFAGMATACKYNAALALLPAFALAWRATERPWRAWVRLGVVAAAAFAVCTPFVVLDAWTAATHIFYELRHYALRGHPGAEYGRGWGNLAFHLEFLARRLGPLAWAAPLGAAWLLLRDAQGRAALLFPLAYLGFMSLQRTAFGRNMEPLFSFLAVCAAAPLELGARAAPGGWLRWGVGLLALAVAVAGIGERRLQVREARGGWSTVDSRTRAMRVVAERAPGLNGAAARELSVHGNDLARAGGTWQVAGADTVARLVAEGRVDWALLPAAAPAPDSTAPGGLRPALRLGARPLLEHYPPEDPALVVWLRVAR